MRKFVVLTLLLLSFPLHAVNFIISGGASLQRELDMRLSLGSMSFSQKGGADNSYDFGFEAFIPLFSMLEVGGGARFEPQLTIEGDEGIADIIPLYLVLKFLIPMGSTALTAQINGGYSLLIPRSDAEERGFTDLKGGPYVGIGVGYEIGSLVIGANYNISTLQCNYNIPPEVTLTALASKVNITVGYKFSYWKRCCPSPKYRITKY